MADRSHMFLAKLPSLLLLLVLFHNLSAVHPIGVNYGTVADNLAMQLSEGEKTWCIPKRGVPDAPLKSNLDFACATGVDCTAIQEGGDCFIPNSVRSHASYAMNSYYQTHGRTVESCDFMNTGTVTTVNPSYVQCVYIS